MFFKLDSETEESERIEGGKKQHNKEVAISENSSKV